MKLTIRDLETIITLIWAFNDSTDLTKSAAFGPLWKNYKKITRKKLMLELHKLENELESEKE